MEENNNSTEEIKDAIPVNDEKIVNEDVKEENETTENITTESIQEEKTPEKENVSNEKKIDTDELKKETVNTVNEVKEKVKNVDIKKESKETTNFVIDFVKNPIGKIKEIADETTNKYFITSIFIIVIWTILILISTISGYTHFFKYNFWDHLVSLIKSMLAPVLGIIVMAVIVLIMNKENKKTLITNINTITATKIPLFLAAIVNLLKLFKLRDTSIITTFSSLCTVISTVLLYFGLKELFGEQEDEKFIKKFLIIEAIFYVVYFIISYLGIYIR